MMWSAAAELWRQWERSGVLRPQDYDADLAEHVRRQLPRRGDHRVGPIPLAMERAHWTARNLVHAVAPLVSSFAGMQRDLLRLLERVGATSGTGENIRVVYEFAEGDPIDESLSAFRERVQAIERVVLHLHPWVFTHDHAWRLPIQEYRSWEWIKHTVESSGAASAAQWRFDSGVPDAPPTGDARADALARRVMALVRYALTRLQTIAANTDDLRHRSSLELDPELVDIAQAASDYWPLSVAAAVHGWAADITHRTMFAAPEMLDALDRWLEGFESPDSQEVTVEQVVDELTDVLSLPQWGRRHELYSAWIATQVDRALDSRLGFVVTDGALRFPFRPTLLAHLDPPHGDISLWCEVRSPGVGELGGGRKASVQPDYRFLRASDNSTVAAIEVKQYKAPAPRRHSVTMRDYVRSLPGATVLLVAHGPLGEGILDAVPADDRHRALLHANVRPGLLRESAALRRDVASLFPPAADPDAASPPPASPGHPPEPAPSRPGTAPAAQPLRPTRIELRWSPEVHDLDLHLRHGDAETCWATPATYHSELRDDQFDGGPEVIDLAPGLTEPLEVRVHVYSPTTLERAAPIVGFVRGDDVLLQLAPTNDLLQSPERWWAVAHIDHTGCVVPSPDSRVLQPGEGAR